MQSSFSFFPLLRQGCLCAFMCRILGQFLQYFMKEEPESLKKIREFTQDAIQHIKTEFVQECLKREYHTCAVYLSQCIDSLEAFISTIMEEFGSEYLRNIHKLSAVDLAVTNLQDETRCLQEKLSAAQALIQEKQHKIASLQDKNSVLRQNIATLQNLIAGESGLTSSESEDSLENLDLDTVEEYVSTNSSLLSEPEQLYQLGEQL